MFESLHDLYAFLLHFTPRLPLFQKLGIASMASNRISRGSLGYFEKLHCTLPLLAGATHLEVLYISRLALRSLGRGPNMAANLFCSNLGARVWLSKMYPQKRFVFKVLEQPMIASTESPKILWYDTKEGQKLFFDELTSCLEHDAPKGIKRL